MFGIASFLFIQDSFNVLESRGILTDLSFVMVRTAGETKQFSVVPSAFSRCPFLISFTNPCRTLLWKWIGTGGLPFCWTGFVSFFSWMSIVKPSIVWLFLNRSSNALRIWLLLSSMTLFRIMFVFRLPCSPISSLSNQSSPKNCCVFLFSVMNIGNVTLLFSVLTSTSASPLIFNRIFVKVYKSSCCFRQFHQINYRRNIGNRGPSVDNEVDCLSLHQ